MGAMAGLCLALAASLLVALLLAVASSSARAATPGAVRDALQRVVDRISNVYNMSISLAYHDTDLQLAVAAGYTDASLGLGVVTRKAVPDDMYIWGSTTKMFTAPAVLQLVELGLVGLTDPVAIHVDPLLQSPSGLRLRDHCGDAIDSVHIEHLLHMTSGIADYDGEAFAKDQFANRTKAFGPVEIITKYVNQHLIFAPGSRQDYCSTNYILLGLVLARHAHVDGQPWSWESYDQLSVVPVAMRRQFNRSLFVTRGLCEDLTPVDGFMQSYSTASLPMERKLRRKLGGW